MTLAGNHVFSKTWFENEQDIGSVNERQVYLGL